MIETISDAITWKSTVLILLKIMDLYLPYKLSEFGKILSSEILLMLYIIVSSSLDLKKKRCVSLFGLLLQLSSMIYTNISVISTVYYKNWGIHRIDEVQSWKKILFVSGFGPFWEFLHYAHSARKSTVYY